VAKGSGQEEIVDRHDNLTVARAIYRGRFPNIPADWSCCVIGLAYWREAIDRKRCRKAVNDLQRTARFQLDAEPLRIVSAHRFAICASCPNAQ
jgi:hypothetical protein